MRRNLIKILQGIAQVIPLSFYQKLSQQRLFLPFYHVIDNFWEELDKEKSYGEIINIDDLTGTPEKISIESRTQIINEKKKLKFPYKLRTGKIFLKEKI